MEILDAGLSVGVLILIIALGYFVRHDAAENGDAKADHDAEADGNAERDAATSDTHPRPFRSPQVQTRGTRRASLEPFPFRLNRDGSPGLLFVLTALTT
jgi:hypothetical protein